MNKYEIRPDERMMKVKRDVIKYINRKNFFGFNRQVPVTISEECYEECKVWVGLKDGEVVKVFQDNEIYFFNSITNTAEEKAESWLEEMKYYEAPYYKIEQNGVDKFRVMKKKTHFKSRSPWHLPGPFLIYEPTEKEFDTCSEAKAWIASKEWKEVEC